MKQRPDVRLILYVVGCAVLIVAFFLAAAVVTETSTWRLFADISSVAYVVPLTGAISALGIMAWASSAAISFFAGILAMTDGKRQQSQFLFFFGGLSSLFALDDQFLLHEWFLPQMPWGNQTLYILLYVVLLIAFCVTQRSMLRENSPLILVVSVAFLASSVAFDAAGDAFGFKPPWAGPTEDCLKFIGIALWLGYAATVSAKAIRSDVKSAHKDDSQFSSEPEDPLRNR